jgi:hypothetical protein
LSLGEGERELKNSQGLLKSAIKAKRLEWLRVESKEEKIEI